MPVVANDIRLCSFDELVQLGDPLFREHYDEVALNKDVMQLKPHELRYRAMEQHDAMFILGAFASRIMVGYSVNLITQHLHYADLTYCANDALFVTGEARNTRLGVELIKRTEREAQSRGAALMQWHAKKDTALDQMLEHAQPYIVQDIIYTRTL